MIHVAGSHGAKSGDLNAQAVFPVAENVHSLERATARQTAECKDFSVQDKHNGKEWGGRANRCPPQGPSRENQKGLKIWGGGGNGAKLPDREPLLSGKREQELGCEALRWPTSANVLRQ